ncbi:MAG TPA: phytanoyl-CoA dioxygenase family protein [Bacilli bacterium]
MITQQDVDFYKENGFLKVSGVFNAQEVEDMRNATDDIVKRAAQTKYDANAQWQGDFLPAEELKKLVLKGFHDAHYHDAAFTRAVTHPNMVAILQQIIGPNVQLHHTKLLLKPPENGAAFPMHQDYPYFPHEQHTMLAASVHMDDTDLENGCLHVIPGSHKQGPLPHVGTHYLNHKEYPVTMGTPCLAKAGDVLFFNYLTIHGSMQNRSNRDRRNVLFQYRAAEDLPTNKDHVNWGQGMMICGKNPVFKNYMPEYALV